MRFARARERPRQAESVGAGWSKRVAERRIAFATTAMPPTILIAIIKRTIDVTILAIMSRFTISECHIRAIIGISPRAITARVNAMKVLSRRSHFRCCAIVIPGHLLLPLLDERVHRPLNRVICLKCKFRIHWKNWILETKRLDSKLKVKAKFSNWE